LLVQLIELPMLCCG